MNDTARHARQSDREFNAAFRRRWREPPLLPPTLPPPAGTDADEEPGKVTLTRWVDEWRAGRSDRSSRQEPARSAGRRS